MILPLKENPEGYFGFNDIHGFKDFVGFVILCAPDLFPGCDWHAPDEQMNLDRAFVGLRYGLDLAVKEKGESELVVKCRTLVDEAYSEYMAGHDMRGQRMLEEFDELLKRLPSE